MNSEQSEKYARICQLLDEKKLDAIVLRRQANVGWAIGGRANIPTTVELSCLDVVVTREGVTIVTNVIEAPRLVAEELNEIGRVIAVPWWQSREAQLPHGAHVGVDAPDSDCLNVGPEIENLRRALNDEEVERLRSISTDSAQAMYEALRTLTGRESEVEVAGAIAGQLWARNLEPVVLLVAGQDRAPQFRHALPTISPIGNRAVASICARRKGLIASATRIVTFGELSDPEVNQYQRLLEVEAAFLDQTTVGNTFGEALIEAVSSYEDQGFDANEWHFHHQGGSTGYLPRDFPATPQNSTPIRPGNVIAWNPTAAGWKVEDTLIVTDSGFEILTIEDNWPIQVVHERKRPALLRH